MSMQKLKLLATAITLLAATPVVAQEMGGAIGVGPQGMPNYYGDDGYYRGYPRYGYLPGEVAGDVVGGAIGTAGAVATAPFRALEGSGSYAMAPGSSYCAERYRSYDPASGTYMGFDGRRHPCH